MSNNLQLPYDIKEQIAEYVPIDWAWVTYENDPVWYMGLYEVEYHRLFKIRASKTVPCTCTLINYTTSKEYDENGNEIYGHTYCMALTHMCQCSGSHNLDIVNRNSSYYFRMYYGYKRGMYVNDHLHYSRCRASRHIIGCHCRYEDMSVINAYNRNGSSLDESWFHKKCSMPVSVHNCICIYNRFNCSAFQHVCICLKLWGFNHIYNLSQKSGLQCRAHAHQCMCWIQQYVDDNYGSQQVQFIYTCMAHNHIKKILDRYDYLLCTAKRYQLHITSNTIESC